MTRDFILSICERREDTIYDGPLASIWPDLHGFLNDPAVERFVKACAVMGALGRLRHLAFPKILRAVHDLVGKDYWAREIALFSPPCFTTGPLRPIYLETGEHYYLIAIGPCDERCFGQCIVYLATSVYVAVEDNFKGGQVHLPLEIPIHRFTLSHPLLRSEMHTPDEILLFKR